MDTISLFGPQQPKGAISQEDFDSRYNFVRHNKKTDNRQILWDTLVTDNWRNYHHFTDFVPVLKWLPRYGIKSSGLRDLFGSIFIAMLLIPQGLSVGFLVDDVIVGLMSLLIPQIVYTILGSARHSSLGSLSHTAFLIYSSQTYSYSNICTLTFCVGLFELLFFVLPSDWLFSLFSSQLLVGFSLGIFARIVFRTISHVFIFKSCSQEIEELCFKGLLSCVSSIDVAVLSLFLCSLLLSLLFRWKLNDVIAQKFGVSLPHEILILALLSGIAYVLDMENSRFLSSYPFFPRESLSLSAPSFPSASLAIDSFSIALFSVSTHYKIARNIAMEKMHKVVRKQELFSFSLMSLLSSTLSLLPPSSSAGNSQINIETAKFSLLSNCLSVAWIVLSFGLLQFTIKYIPICVVCGLMMTSFSGILSDIRSIRSLCYSHPNDAIVAVSALLCAIFIKNSCQALLVALAISLLIIIFRIQSSHSDVLIKVADNFYAEENRYTETECMDAPVRIIRITAPLCYANADSAKRHIYRQVTVVKGLIGIGIGSRTVSMRSTGAVGPKESIDAKSSLNLTNIVITHDADVQTGRLNSEAQVVTRFIVLDCGGMSIIDSDAIKMLSQVYFDLSNDHIRLMFAGVSASVRDSLQLAGFYSNVPLSAFYPTVGEALCAARHIVMPFHMSVSMNGCRDVITLSTAGSNQDISISRHSPEAV